MNDTGDRRARTIPDIRRRPRNRTGGRKPAEKRTRNVRQTLPD